MEQIASKTPGPNFSRRVAIGSRYQADIHADTFAATQPVKPAVVEDSQYCVEPAGWILMVAGRGA
jgi:hypothetical protein